MNKIINKQTIVMLLVTLALVCASCNDWFEVTASNEIRKEDHYSSVEGFRQTLTGCYIAMGEEDLFGRNLSWFLPELTAHQYRRTSSAFNQTPYFLQEYQYSNMYIKPICEAIWQKSYNVIANANDALSKIDEQEALFHPIDYHVIKGELLAIRAYMHFQLLRLYGYGNRSARMDEINNKPTIPYVTEVSKETTPQSTGKEVITLLLHDLEDAANLLKEYDPISSSLDWSDYTQVNQDYFYKNRNFHLNYYAVRALQAQVYMWDGSEQARSEALKAATEIIRSVGDGIEHSYFNHGNYITYMLKLLDTQAITRPNYSMTPEALFSISVLQLENKTKEYIIPYFEDTDYSAFYIEKDVAEELYEHQASDFRFNTLLQLNTTAGIVGYVPLKLYQESSVNYYYKNKISLIRLPEIYYIAAECLLSGSTPDPTGAIAYLNIIREKRGLYTPLEGLTVEEIQQEITKEYQKEFLCEGVMFYYYKRTGATSIPYKDDMSDAEYVLPYPDFEIQSGRVQ